MESIEEVLAAVELMEEALGPVFRGTGKLQTASLPFFVRGRSEASK